jgi:hypothetical protein
VKATRCCFKRTTKASPSQNCPLFSTLSSHPSLQGPVISQVQPPPPPFLGPSSLCFSTSYLLLLLQKQSYLQASIGIIISSRASS